MSIITQDSTDEVALIDHILMTALIASLCDTLRLSNDQISVFMLDFESKLPKHLQNALHPKPKTA